MFDFIGNTVEAFLWLCCAVPIIGFLADWQDLRIALMFILLLFGLMAFLSFRVVRA